MDRSIWDLMSHGGVGTWVLIALCLVLAFSVLALAVGIERAIAQWKFVTRARSLGDVVTRCLSRGALDEGRSACERSPSPVADVFLVGYERLGRSKPEHVVTAVHRERLRVNQDLRTRLWMLGTVGATAPFIGLFGTVVGIIAGLHKFHSGQEVTFADVAGPVSEALIVTAVGIGVAVEAVVLFNFFSQRGNRIATEMRLITDEFLELLLDAPEGSQPTRAKKPERQDEPAPPEKPSQHSREARAKGDGDGDREAA